MTQRGAIRAKIEKRLWHSTINLIPPEEKAMLCKMLFLLLISPKILMVLKAVKWLFLKKIQSIAWSWVGMLQPTLMNKSHLKPNMREVNKKTWYSMKSYKPLNLTKISLNKPKKPKKSSITIWVQSNQKQKK